MPIISLTTIPSRLEQGIQPTLESLSTQGYDVYLWIPKYFKRKGIKFNGNIPSYIKKLGIKYNVVEDNGSITKLYPALSLNSNLIITADDDVIYPQSWASNLTKAYNDNPGKAYCYRGRIFKPHTQEYRRTTLIRNKAEPREVDIITGVWGALYHKKFFGNMPLPIQNKPEYFVDDIWISGHLAEQKIKRICLPNPGIQTGNNHKIDSLTRINWKLKNTNNTEVIKKFRWYAT